MYDAPHQRVKKVSITLECTPGFHQTQCEALEGACPERMRSFRERSLSALWKAGSGFPDLPCASEAAPLLRAFTQVPSMRSACALANFHGDGRCLPPPFQNHACRGRPVRGPGALGESGWASRGARASPICTRGAGRRESHFGGRHRISYRSIRSPVGPRRPGRHGEVGGVLISILG